MGTKRAWVSTFYGVQAFLDLVGRDLVVQAVVRDNKLLIAVHRFGPGGQGQKVASLEVDL
jgi:hypothetical protein